MSNIYDIAARIQERRDVEQALVREKEIKIAERAKEKIDERWFQAKMLIIGALLGALITKMLDIFLK